MPSTRPIQRITAPLKLLIHVTASPDADKRYVKHDMATSETLVRQPENKKFLGTHRK